MKLKGALVIWLGVALAALPVAAQEVTQGGSVAPAGGVESGPRHLLRAHFTSGVAKREPVDRIDQIDSGRPRVYYFSELRGLSGRTVTHRWKYHGRLVAEVRHQVGAARWRAWSSKRLLPMWEGEWSVSVVDEEGDTLRTDTLLVVPPAVEVER